MRRKKWVCLAFTMFILSLTVIFSNVEQDKRRRITSSSHRDVYSIKNKIFGSRNNQQSYSCPSIEIQPQCVPDEVLVGFEDPLSDFDAAYLIGDYLYKRFGRLDSNWDISRISANNLHRIRFPENFSVEQMIQVMERNPYVIFVEPNNIGHIAKITNENGDYFPNKLNRIRSKSIKDVRGVSSLMDIEPTPKAGSERRFYKTLKKRDKQQHKNINGETNIVRADNDMRKIQSSDNKPIIRYRTKIYKYRDSEGRLVLTNCYFNKRNN